MMRWLLSLLVILPPIAGAERLENVQSFAYQLQEISLEELAASPLNLAVMDYSLDGSDEQAFTLEQINTFRASGKLAIAYLSIGEAEEYRYYFNPKWVRELPGGTCGRALTDQAPPWLDKPNPNWCGNYKTRYWNKRWKKIIFGIASGPKKSYLDRIIDAGFDGIYLDIIDAFEYKRFRKEHGGIKKTAKDMITFVAALANYARTVRNKPNFIVIPQNGASIIDEVEDSDRAKYFDAIDGIGAEDTFFFGDEDVDNELDPQQFAIDALGQYVDAGKKVLAIDYLLDANKVSQFVTLACNEGFIPQVSNRDLDTFQYHRTTSPACE